MSLHILGIRHHGPGSARSVLAALHQLRPDILLVEGPPDAASILPLMASTAMRPPVALLIYALKTPQKAVYYPFAVFSPEWQAIQYALGKRIPVQFMDLPQAHQLAREMSEPSESRESSEPGDADHMRLDPLGRLAQAAGYPDGERWWEQVVEHRREGTDLFEAVLEAMSALREDTTLEAAGAEREPLREAFMRQTVRSVQGRYKRIAVVCGAWHGPALRMPEHHTASDALLLSNLPSVEVAATWIPWTHSRLSMYSGYGAGIRSPGWYEHLWECKDAIVARWLTKVAHLLREEDIQASTAQIIDAVRLAETLAGMRDLPIPGLEEMNEVTRAVLCFGNTKPLELISRKLIIGDRMGSVPEVSPMMPIQRDLLREQKRLALRPDAGEHVLALDLRVLQHLERSHLLHRLLLLGVAWGDKIQPAGKGGTFREIWKLNWHPEFTIALIERSIWGNTVRDAATAYTQQRAQDATTLTDLTQIIGEVFLAELTETAEYVSGRLEDIAALTSDVKVLMRSLPAMIDVFIYGNVRQNDATMLQTVIDSIVVRIWINITGACALLSDEAAAEMFDLLCQVNGALQLLDRQDYLQAWRGVLKQLLEMTSIHGLICGRCCRILFDASVLNADDVARLMRLEMSGNEQRAVAWLDGFLRGSALVLLYNVALIRIIDEWVVSLADDAFTALLPLLRRTFASFTEPERQKIGFMLRGKSKHSQTSVALDEERANAVLPTIAHLLGLGGENQ